VCRYRNERLYPARPIDGSVARFAIWQGEEGVDRHSNRIDWNQLVNGVAEMNPHQLSIAIAVSQDAIGSRKQD
jgi:hypothetical protein